MLLGGSAYGMPMSIASISADDMAMSYNASTGTMTFSDLVNVVVEYGDNSQVSYDGCNVLLTTTLSNDVSTGGFAIADFSGGQIIISQGATDLLTCNLGELSIGETPRATSNVLAGTGVYKVVSGAMMPSFGAMGDLFAIEFKLSLPVSDFGKSFTGRADMSLTPSSYDVPEPATMAVLCLGGFLLRRRTA